MTYQEAVQYAVVQMSERLKQMKGRRSAHRLRIGETLISMSNLPVGAAFSFKELEDAAHTDAEIFHSLSWALAHRLLDDKPLSADQRLWIALILMGQKKAPNKRKSSLMMTEAIIAVVSQLVENGLNASRNEDGIFPLSACDAVADAMERLETDPKSYSRVKKHWEARLKVPL
jgi:hypothetical protein